MMLARNNMERELEKAKKSHKNEKTILENQIEELQKLSSIANETITSVNEKPTHASPQTSPNISALISEKSVLLGEKRSLEEDNQSLLAKLQEAEEKLFTLTTELQLAKSQHDREVQDLKLAEQSRVSSEAYSKLESELKKQAEKCIELEKALNIRSTEGRKLLLGELRLQSNILYRRTTM